MAGIISTPLLFSLETVVLCYFHISNSGLVSMLSEHINTMNRNTGLRG